MTLPRPSALLDAYDRCLPIAAADRVRGESVAEALACQREIVALRQARGERRRGYKIGFTNRGIWPLYGVSQPIWAPVWDTTLVLLDAAEATVHAQRYVEPRLEPEIVIGLESAPPVDALADPQRLAESVAWIAHGIEIVQSPWPQWRFSAAEAIAAQGLHGLLLVGPRITPARAGLAQTLAQLRLRLFRDGQPVAEGVGSNVLDGPLHALAHLAAALREQHEPLAAGDVVTTGTLTDAMPIAAGQRWHTQIDGLPLPGLQLSIR